MSRHIPKNQIAESTQQKVTQHLQSAQHKFKINDAESIAEIHG